MADSLKDISDKRPRGRRPIRRKIAAYRETRPDKTRIVPRRAAVPSFFTLMNLFSGFLAIIQIADGRFTYAAWLIVLAGFFDLLDGMMARLAQAQSDFGIQLDSLSDVVSFGLAPSFLVYKFGLDQFGMPGLMIASLPAICGAVRLARFNVAADGDKKAYYEGLPIPVQAAVIVTFILTFRDLTWFDRFAMGAMSVLIPMVIGLSALMITSINFAAIPKLTVESLRRRPYQVLALAVGILMTLFLQEVGLFLAMIGYLLLNVGASIYRFVLAVWRADNPSNGN
ncbi:MAG TPA: CDP-diacylglycerol--serine O-phosphatidyltransferase [Rhodothermia bacterium]|nr:CDP-diacylglycerol--serine O-phosphatidyltransferase [Rhodothermia bacterium]